MKNLNLTHQEAYVSKVVTKITGSRETKLLLQTFGISVGTVMTRVMGEGKVKLYQADDILCALTDQLAENIEVE